MAFGIRSSLAVGAVVVAAAGLLPRSVVKDAIARMRNFWGAFDKHPRLGLLLLIAVFLVPAFAFASWISRYGVAVPKMDDWDVAALIADAHAGKFSCENFVVQQQEGRTVIPRLIYLASTFCGRWDVRDLMFLTIATCWASTALVLVLLLRSGISRAAIAICSVSAVLLIFSPAQYEVLTFAFGFPSFLPAFFILLALVIVGSRWSTSGKFLCCVAIALASSFTLPHGLLAWGLTFPVLILQQRVTSWRSWFAGWTLAAALCAAAYFHGYQKPADLPPFAPPTSAVAYGEFFLAFLGGAFQNASKAQLSSAITAALIYGAAFCGATAYLVRHWRSEALRKASAPWFALAGYSVGSALLATLGRVSYGVPYALSSRYIPFSIFFLIATVVLASISLSHFLCSLGRRATVILASCIAVLSGLALFVQLHCIADGLFFLRAQSARDRLGRAALEFSRVIDTSAAIRATIYPPGLATIRENADRLDREGLLRPRLIPPTEFASLPRAECDGVKAAGVWEKRSEHNGVIEASGWAALPQKSRNADAVLLAFSRPGENNWTPFAFSNAVVQRFDVARQLQHEDKLDARECVWSGWKVEYPGNAVPPGAIVSVWAIDANGPLLYRIR